MYSYRKGYSLWQQIYLMGIIYRILPQSELTSIPDQAFFFSGHVRDKVKLSLVWVNPGIQNRGDI